MTSPMLLGGEHLTRNLPLRQLSLVCSSLNDRLDRETNINIMEQPNVVDGLRHGFLDGLSTVVLTLLLLALVPIILAQPYSSLVPVFARDIFDIGATGQGLLLSAPGVGAVVGALIVARMSDSRLASTFLLAGVVVFGLGLVAFALSSWLPMALVALLVVGIASTAYRAVNQTLLQTHTEDDYRGRVMSIYLLDRGLAPLGSLLAGTLAMAFGATGAVAILGMLTAIFGIA